MSNIGPKPLFDKHDIDKSMQRIEAIDFHQEFEVDGIKFWSYHAGHVLGAAMFMIEIAGVKVFVWETLVGEEGWRGLFEFLRARDPPPLLTISISASTLATFLAKKIDISRRLKYPPRGLMFSSRYDLISLLRHSLQRT